MHPKILMWSWVQRLTQIKFVGPPLGDIINGMMQYQARPRVLVGAIIISIFGHFGMLSAFFFCSLALQFGSAAPDYWTHLMLIPGAEVASVFVPVPGGVGALEGAVIYVYHWTCRLQKRPDWPRLSAIGSSPLSSPSLALRIT